MGVGTKPSTRAAQHSPWSWFWPMIMSLHHWPLHLVLLFCFCSSLVKCALVNVQFTDAAPGEKLPADLLTNTAQWTPEASLTDTAVEAMECAVRCTQQDTTCKSFLTTNHTCYLGKDAPAIDSFVEAAGQTVSYYLKAWKIFWTFTLTLTPLSFVARDLCWNPLVPFIWHSKKKDKLKWDSLKKNGNMFTVPLAKFNFGLSFALVLFVIKHKKHLLSYLQYLWLSLSWLFL